MKRYRDLVLTTNILPEKPSYSYSSIRHSISLIPAIEDRSRTLFFPRHSFNSSNTRSILLTLASDFYLFQQENPQNETTLPSPPGLHRLGAYNYAIFQREAAGLRHLHAVRWFGTSLNYHAIPDRRTNFLLVYCWRRLGLDGLQRRSRNIF